MRQIITSFTSPYFQIEQLADGLYAAIVVGGVGAWGNAGIVDLGEQTLVFDTFNTPAAAASLRAAAEQLTGRPVNYVVNSHHHSDHILGNQVFEGATIFASDITFDLMLTKGIARFEKMRNHPIPLAALEAVLEQEEDTRIRTDMQLYINEIRALSASLPDLRFRLPDVTFERRLVFAGSKYTAVLLTFGGGHSPSDAFLYLPEASLAFMSDLVQIGFHPDFSDGNPDEWLRILAKVETFELATVVPGHGTVGTGQDIHGMIRYIQTLQQCVVQAIQAGISLEQLVANSIPAPYTSWQASPVLKKNLQFLYEQFVSGHR